MKHNARRVAEFYESACVAANGYVEELARKILAEHSTLDEFVMGMGIACFTDKKGDSLDLEDRAYMKPLADFINEWDDFLKITGEPMRFTANGPRITNW